MYKSNLAAHHISSLQGGPARAWRLKLIILHRMRKLCTILSMGIGPTSHNMAPLFRHLHLTPRVLACAPARLATGARRVSTRVLGCGQPLASLRQGCRPQYQLCLPECLQPTQVLRKHTGIHCTISWIIFWLDKSKWPLCCSHFCRRDGGFSEHPVGEHIHPACLH